MPKQFGGRFAPSGGAAGRARLEILKNGRLVTEAWRDENLHVSAKGNIEAGFADLWGSPISILADGAPSGETVASFGSFALPNDATEVAAQIGNFISQTVVIRRETPISATYNGAKKTLMNRELSLDVGAELGFGDPRNIRLGNGEARVSIPAGSHFKGPAGGLGFADYRITSHPIGDKEGILRYQLRFEEGFDFALGGKLPGIAGGGDNSGGDDVYGGHAGWSARLMWHGAGRGPAGYNHPYLKLYYYGCDRFDNLGVEHHEAGISYPAASPIADGVWYDVGIRVRTNDLGQQNGIVQVWIDDSLVIDQQTLEPVGDYGMLIDYLMFDIFRGGNNDTWASNRDGAIAVRNITYETVEAGSPPVAPTQPPDPVCTFLPENYKGGTWTGTGSGAFNLTQGGSGADPVTGTDDFGSYVQQDGRKLRNSSLNFGTFSIVARMQFRNQSAGNTTFWNFSTLGLVQLRNSRQLNLIFRGDTNNRSPEKIIAPGRAVSVAFVVDDTAQSAILYLEGREMVRLDTSGLTLDPLKIFELGLAPLGMRTYNLRFYNSALSQAQVAGASVPRHGW